MRSLPTHPQKPLRICKSNTANSHGGAHPATAVLGHGIRADPKFFGGRRGDGGVEDGLGNRPADALYTVTLYYIYMKFTASCLHMYLTSGASPPQPYRSSAPGSRWGSSVPHTLCAHPDFRAWLRHCRELWPRLNGHMCPSVTSLLIPKCSPHSPSVITSLFQFRLTTNPFHHPLVFFTYSTVTLVLPISTVVSGVV